MHSPYSSLKSFAANNIKVFIKEFEDLQDDAINAVYDLCEDQDPRVRSAYHSNNINLIDVFRYVKMVTAPLHRFLASRRSG